jgi:hypothetical protein
MKKEKLSYIIKNSKQEEKRPFKSSRPFALVYKNKKNKIIVKTHLPMK